MRNSLYDNILGIIFAIILFSALFITFNAHADSISNNPYKNIQITSGTNIVTSTNEVYLYKLPFQQTITTENKLTQYQRYCQQREQRKQDILNKHNLKDQEKLYIETHKFKTKEDFK